MTNKEINNTQIEFTVATNFDNELIPGIIKYNKHNQIKSVFGKMSIDIIGGGRSTMILPNINFRKLKNYIDLCHKNNLKFNYLLNSLCLGNKEINPASHKRIIKFLGKLYDIGVNAVTVNTPFLCEIIKKQFPKLKITVGLNSRIIVPKSIKEWEALGADEITLHHSVNRNFTLLENILYKTRNSNIKLRLIANNACLHDCPYEINHAVGTSHSSQTGNRSNLFYLDYNILSCNNLKINNPVKIISSEWIRPEDINYYEELCKKTGNYNLSLKLLERTKTTNFIIGVVKAYTERKYDGNLLKLLNWASIGENKKLQIERIRLGALMSKYKLKKLYELREVSDTPYLYVDNKKLDGFINHFLTNFNCNNKICDDEGWLKDDEDVSNEPLYCSYCREWAKKVITFDTQKISNWLKKSNQFITNELIF